MAKHRLWHDFEILLTTIHKNVAPGAEVTHNCYLRGRSGRRRQLDILLSQTIGLYEAKIVIECRRYKRQVTIEKVEAFAAKLADIGAAQGVMISIAGFDAGAKAIARDNRIALLTYREATELDWSAATSAAAWVRMIFSHREVVSIAGDTGAESNTQLPLDFLISAQGHDPVSVRDIANSAMEEYPLGQRPGDYVLELDADDSLVISIGGETHRVRGLRLVCRVRSFEYIINLRLATGHILSDSLEGGPRYRELVSMPWDMHQLLNSPPARELTGEAFDHVKAEGKPFTRIDPTKMKRFLRVRLTQGPEDINNQEAG